MERTRARILHVDAFRDAACSKNTVATVLQQSSHHQPRVLVCLPLNGVYGTCEGRDAIPSKAR
jgi:hypothetical protein